MEYIDGQNAMVVKLDYRLVSLMGRINLTELVHRNGFPTTDIIILVSMLIQQYLLMVSNRV